MSKNRCDLLIVNADVVTMDPAFRAATSIAVANGRIAAVGVDLGTDWEGPVWDAQAATVVPAFHDAHNHMAWFGLSLAELDLRTPTVTNLTDLYDAVRDRALSTDDDAWVVGSGYDQNKIRWAPHSRRSRSRRSGPQGVDQACLRSHVRGQFSDSGRARSRRQGPRGRRGVVAIDADGRPTGLLEERAQSLASALVTPYSIKDLVDAIERAGKAYLAEGIGSCVEAGVGGGWIGKSPIELAAYQTALDADRLPVRVQVMVASDVLHPAAAHKDDGISLGLDLGIRTGFGNSRLSLGPVKVFADGSLIGHKAAMSDPFNDLPHECGYLQADPEDLHRVIVEAHMAGWQVAAHAIGDRAIDVVLDAYTAAQSRYRRADARHRIEHFGVARPDQVIRAAELQVVPVPQGRFVHEIGDGMISALGSDRLGWCYRQRSLLDAGMVVPGSSDRPVVRGAPLLGIHDMVNRRTESGEVLGETEAVTPRQALFAYTMGSAYAAHRERILGSTTPGKRADLAILSESPLSVAHEQIGEIDVVATIVDGRVAYPRSEQF